MISEIEKKIIEKSIENSSNKDRQKILNNNILKYYNNVSDAKFQYKNINLAKKRAGSIKHRVLNNLDKYLIEFEASFTKRGGKVIWALDDEQALNEIYNILIKNDIKSIIKSKSLICNEIGLYEFLKRKNIDVLESDLVDFINNGIEKNGNINNLTSLDYLSKEEIYQYVSQKYGISKNTNINDIIKIISKIQRESIIKSEASIIEGNFIISDIGGIIISENDGNAVLSSSISKINIIVSSIERILPNLQDLDLFLPLYSTFSKGNKLFTYNTILTGPRQDNENDGPLEMYVILIDNNRTKVIEKKEQRKAMSCIQCGACSNFCPIYNIIGQDSYTTVYKGAIGSIITPFLKDSKDYNHLSYTTTLCGKCSEECPVNIPLHELLLHNRNDFVNKKELNYNEKILIWSWKKINLSRKLMNLGSSNLKNKLIKHIFSNIWGSKRNLPIFSSKNFNQQWKDKNKNT
jgi:L-lactate dehydrogenase complex protein LldF